MTCREKLMQEHPECIDKSEPGGCKGCPSRYSYMVDPHMSYCCSIDGCDRCWDREIPGTEPTTSPDPAADKGDAVNHPSHYNNGGMECIDEMVLIFGIEATMHFCLLNAWKYRARCLYKNGEEDVKKSHWYLAKYKELKELKEGKNVRET